jgi:hypothetical protein
MANATAFSHPVSDLSWSSSSSVTALTETSTTTVTNSSGVKVYWEEGTNSGSIPNNGTLNCTQGPVDRTTAVSKSKSGLPRITLTVTGSGGGA